MSLKERFLPLLNYKFPNKKILQILSIIENFIKIEINELKKSLLNF